ncbi:MAG: hypothetical protein IJV16_05975 [Lachnospiraceae bacterium]|nr:hypothetical protein [Lachnospiraceae bacterium]
MLQQTLSDSHIIALSTVSIGVNYYIKNFYCQK